MTVTDDPIAHLQSLSYRWGNLQCLRYDPVRRDVFPGYYLVDLYDRAAKSGRSRLGILPSLFCGMTDLSCEAIIAYLRSVHLVILGEWLDDQTHPPRFCPLGFTFPVTLTVARSATPNSNYALGAYGFFQSSWRTPQQQVLSWLGLAYLFGEFSLAALGGSRYTSNQLTARWTRQFGFRDVGTMPNFLLDSFTGDTVSATFSVLERDEFARRLGGVLGSV